MRKVQPVSSLVQVSSHAAILADRECPYWAKHQLKPVITAIGEAFTRNGIAIFPRLIIVGGDARRMAEA